jgi:hypothetical protein
VARIAWYGMPAYARDGKVVCFVRGKLDPRALWPTAFAPTAPTAVERARIAALVKKAAGGARPDPAIGAEIEIAAFRNDVRRLIAVGSVAGGSTPLTEGEALFMGGEVAARLRHPGGACARASWSWLPVAEQTTPFRQVLGGATVAGGAAGLRQPYAPEHAFTGTVGLEWRGLDGLVEMVHSGAQYADFANTLAPSADGQRGRLGAPHHLERDAQRHARHDRRRGVRERQEPRESGLHRGPHAWHPAGRPAHRARRSLVRLRRQMVTRSE